MIIFLKSPLLIALALNPDIVRHFVHAQTSWHARDQNGVSNVIEFRGTEMDWIVFYVTSCDMRLILLTSWFKPWLSMKIEQKVLT